ncbi:hypothetical protein AB0B57_01885 [Micromonospora sp. NPDC049101]|uniref:hypothetical protein n=1 Tax=Micromonospora sp. NPDC049101 TaxID=3155032 RepID=UPI003411147F
MRDSERESTPDSASPGKTPPADTGEPRPLVQRALLLRGLPSYGAVPSGGPSAPQVPVPRAATAEPVVAAPVAVVAAPVAEVAPARGMSLGSWFRPWPMSLLLVGVVAIVATTLGDDRGSGDRAADPLPPVVPGDGSTVVTGGPGGDQSLTPTTVPPTAVPTPSAPVGSAATGSAPAGSAPASPNRAPTNEGIPKAPADAPNAVAPRPVLVLDDFDGQPAWPSTSRNDLGLWTGAESFSNGGGAGVVTAGALTLRYANDGWFGSDVTTDLSRYSYLVIRIKGSAGGEQKDFHVRVGPRTTVFADLVLDGGQHPVVTTSYQDIRIPLKANGFNSVQPEEVSMGFWHGDNDNDDGHGTVLIDSLSFVG